MKKKYVSIYTQAADGGFDKIIRGAENNSADLVAEGLADIHTAGFKRGLLFGGLIISGCGLLTTGAWFLTDLMNHKKG